MKRFPDIALTVIAAFYISSVSQAAPIVYNVGFGDAPIDGHSLRLTGTVEADTSTGEIIASHLSLIHTDLDCTPFNCEVRVRGVPLSGPIPRLGTISGDPKYHWQATPTELRFFGDSPNWFDSALVSWIGGGGGIEDSYFALEQNPAGPDSGLGMSIHYESSFHGHFVRGPSADTAVGLLVGTAAVPEPSTYTLVSTAMVLIGGFAAGRKRFK